MDDDFFRDIDSRGRDNLFLWTVLILLLIGFAMACWLGTYYIFGHPENPRSYRILKKLKKVDPPKRFEVTAAPPGEFRSARQLYDKYITYSRLQLEQENANLIQNYIYNYQSTKLLVPYITGRFTILDSYELRKTDMFSPGVVALAQASDFPQVLIEYVYTSPETTVPLLDQMLHTGLDIKLERTLDLSAIIHIAKIYDGRLQFTVVPLLYGSYALKQATGSFSLEPPADLNMDAGVPIIKTALLQEAFRSYADFKKNSEPMHAAPKLAFSSSPTPSPTPANTELVRVETPTPSPTPTPVVIATPTPTPGLIASLLQPKPRPKHSPAHSPTPTPARFAALSGTPRPALPATPTPSLSLPRVTPAVPVLPRSTPAPTPQRSISPEGVPLQPFLVAAPTPNTTTDNIGTWRTFPPGQIPHGRLIDVPQAEALTDSGIGAEHIYLRGSFVVTASGEGRAVLRTHNASGPNLVPFNSSGSGSPRVIVEFPAGTVPPGEGQTFSRDEYRPFQVTQVRRGSDGQINIYVREITTPN